MKNRIPILEYDLSKDVIIDPQKVIKPIDISEHCVVCFFQEVIKKLHRQKKSKIIHVCKSEMGEHPVYEMRFKRKRVAFFHPGVGASLAAGLLEEVIALGCKKFIACGGSGILDKNIEVGYIIVPISAIRDEGTSYHYLPPAREVNASKEGIKAIENVLKRHNIKYKKAKTWTTDGFYRETVDKIKLRKSEGCLTVEMEAAAFFAVAKYRNVEAIVELCYGIVQHLIAYGMELKHNKHLDSHVGLAKFLTTNQEEEISEKFTNLDILRQGRGYGGKGNGEIVRECLRIVEEIERWTRE